VLLLQHRVDGGEQAQRGRSLHNLSMPTMATEASSRSVVLREQHIACEAGVSLPAVSYRRPAINE